MTALDWLELQMAVIFKRGLRYNMGATRPLACVQLTGTKPVPKAMFVVTVS